MLGNSAGGEECEVRLGAAVTAARWAEIRSMVLSGVKMGERGVYDFFKLMFCLFVGSSVGASGWASGFF